MSLVDLISKIGPTLVAAFAAAIAISKYFYEKNRTFYERRLNEVYAPLYGYLIQQETFRKLYIGESDVKDAPIFTSENVIRTTHTEPGENGLIVTHSEERIVGFFDRKNFIQVLNQSNKGLARPRLLILLNQYHMLIHIEETAQEQSLEWQKATKKKVEVEYQLFREITEGYEDTVSLLKLDGSGEIIDPEKIVV